MVAYKLRLRRLLQQMVEKHNVIRTKMYKAFSDLSLCSLMVAKTESIRQEKTKKKLEEMRGRFYGIEHKAFYLQEDNAHIQLM